MVASIVSKKVKITKSKPLCQSWNSLPLPSSESFGFFGFEHDILILLQNFLVNMSIVDEMADCNKISLKFEHKSYAT